MKSFEQPWSGTESWMGFINAAKMIVRMAVNFNLLPIEFGLRMVFPYYVISRLYLSNEN